MNEEKNVDQGQESSFSSGAKDIGSKAAHALQRCVLITVVSTAAWFVGFCLFGDVVGLPALSLALNCASVVNVSAKLLLMSSNSLLDYIGHENDATALDDHGFFNESDSSVEDEHNEVNLFGDSDQDQPIYCDI